MNESYIHSLPGMLKDATDRRTDLLELLHLKNDVVPLAPDMASGYGNPPLATLQVGGHAYDLGKLLGIVGDALVTPTAQVPYSGTSFTVRDAAARAAVNPFTTILPSQPGTGNPSSSNVRPISGWDAATLIKKGKNIVSHMDYTTTNGHADTLITADVIDVRAPTGYDYGKIPIRITAGTTYTLVIDWEVYGRDESATGETVCSYRIDKLQSSATQIRVRANTSRRLVKVYSATEDVEANILWYPNFGSTVKACSRSRVMLLEGAYTDDNAPPFEPFTAQPLVSALPKTVYGGTLNWATGALKVTHKCVMLDGSLDWKSGTNHLYCQLPDRADESTLLSDRYITSTAAPSSLAAGTMCLGTTFPNVVFANPSNALSVASWKTQLNKTPIQLVYELAEPEIIQIQPKHLTLSEGINYIDSPCGPTDMICHVSFNAHLNERLTAIENAILAMGANI